EVTELDAIKAGLSRPTWTRTYYLRYAFRAGMTLEELHELTYIDPWFLQQLHELVEMEQLLEKTGSALTAPLLKRAKEFGFTDLQISNLTRVEKAEIKRLRQEWDIHTIYRLVDTCAAEFEAYTPYYYSTYGDENEIIPSDRQKI